MSRLHKVFVLAITTSVISVGCNNHKTLNLVDYQPLEDYQYTPASVTPGSEIELLAFSGGKRSDENNLYYYQFVGIDKSKGDTIKILLPVISIDEDAGVETKTYTTPLQFNPDKGITTAYFEQLPSDTALNLINGTEANPGGEISTEKIQDMLDGKSHQKAYVVLNKSIDLFQRNYKAVIGVLNFKQIPW